MRTIITLSTRLSGAMLLLTVNVGAFAVDAQINRLQACMSEAEAVPRLACYDREMARIKAAPADDLGMTPSLAKQKQKASGDAVATAPTPEQTLSARVVAIGERDYGKLIVTLDNGQVWAQTEALNFPVRVGDTVTIRPGMMGAYWMSGTSRNVQRRVKRVK